MEAGTAQFVRGTGHELEGQGITINSLQTGSGSTKHFIKRHSELSVAYPGFFFGGSSNKFS